jgi:hypothetical protein
MRIKTRVRFIVLRNDKSDSALLSESWRNQERIWFSGFPVFRIFLFSLAFDSEKRMIINNNWKSDLPCGSLDA